VRTVFMDRLLDAKLQLLHVLVFLQFMVLIFNIDTFLLLKARGSCVLR